MYVVLAIFMLMVTVHKPRLRLYFSQNQLVATIIYNCWKCYILFKRIEINFWNAVTENVDVRMAVSTIW